MRKIQKMKKIIATFIVLMTVITLALTVHGENEAFSVKVSGREYASVGDEVTYTVAIGDVVADKGFRIIFAELSYDTNFFEYVSFTLDETATTVSGWDFEGISHNNGTITLNILDNGMFASPEVDNSLVTGKSIVYKLKLKVKANDAESGEIKVNSAKGGAFASFTDSGACDSFTVKLMKKLSMPSGLTFNGKNAKWDAVENATGYTVQLYKDGEKLGNAVNCSGTSYNFSTDIEKNLGGAYSFTVTATSTSAEYGDSDTATSEATSFTGKLLPPEIELEVNKIKGNVTFKITDPNPDDTVSAYIIKVYDGNEIVKELTSTGKSGTIEGLTLGKEFNVTVLANSASIDNQATGNAHSNESDKEKVKTDGIVGIKVSKKPNLSYTEGDVLDLSAMEITVDFAVASDVKVKRSKFSDYGITVTPKHNSDITLSMNGKKLTVTCGDLTAEAELVLEVKPAQCPHGSTTDEHQDATCGANGFDRTICSLCGETVTETILQATGEHEYGEWVWKSKPTTAIDGVRERRCAKCEGVEIDQVTYAEYIAMTSADTSETEPPETTPEETETTKPTPPETTEKPKRNNALGGIGDLGKIFLFALIAILVVIVLFIVGAIYIESRQNRRRKSRARTNQAKATQSRANQSKTQSRPQSTANRNGNARK